MILPTITSSKCQRDAEYYHIMANIYFVGESSVGKMCCRRNGRTQKYARISFCCHGSNCVWQFRFMCQLGTADYIIFTVALITRQKHQHKSVSFGTWPTTNIVALSISINEFSFQWYLFFAVVYIQQNELCCFEKLCCWYNRWSLYWFCGILVT